MTDSPKGVAMIVGVGPGLGSALCAAFRREGYAVAAMGRSLAADAPYAHGARVLPVDTTDQAAVERAVGSVERQQGPINALIYNAAMLHVGAFADLTADRFEAVWRATCFGAFVTARAVLPLMEERGRGAALFTGATASVRGGANFAAFASAKFALRGLVQSLSRAYWPNGVHVAHAVIDGRISDSDGALKPDDIASAYLALINQPRSAWTQEFDLRPNVEKF